MRDIAINKSDLIEKSINFLIALFIIFSLIHKLELFNIKFITQTMLVIFGLSITFFISIIFKDQLPLKNIVSKTTLFLLLLFVFIILNSFFVRFEFQLGAIFSLVLGIAFGKHFAESKKSYWIVLFPFWLLSIYIVMRLLENPDPNMVFIRSRNYISFYLLITVLPYYFLRTKNREKMSVVPALVLLLLSLYSLGRSGIISSMILFMGVILHSINNLKFKVFIILSTLVTIGFLIFYFLDYYELYLEYDRFSNLETISTIGGRTSFLSNYYNHLDLFGLIFGLDTNNPAILRHGSYLAGHIHSSILNFISVIGILFVIFLYFLLKKMKMFARYNPTFNFFLIALLVRVSTEDGLLFDFFDFTLWMFFFVNIKNLSQNLVNTKTRVTR